MTEAAVPGPEPIAFLAEARLGQPVAAAMVPQTVGNRSGLTGYRSNRSGPVPVESPGTQPAKIQNLNLNSKNKKFPKKILKIIQVAMNLMVSNFLKNLFI